MLIDTTCDVQCAVLKVIFDHAYKGKQESINFVLNLKQHLPGADGSMFVVVVVGPGATKKPAAASYLAELRIPTRSICLVSPRARSSVATALDEVTKITLL